MDLLDVIKKRHSVRKFQNREVEEEKISKILEVIEKTPSAGNLRSFKVFVVKEREKRKALAQAAFGQNFLAQAPIVLVFCADEEKCARYYGIRGRTLYCIQDATIACTYAMLMATALGLGSCWVGAFDEEKVKEILGTDLRPVALLPIGYKGVKKAKKEERWQHDSDW